MNPKQRATIPSELNALERAALAAARWSWALLTTLSLSCNMNPVPEDPGVTQGDGNIPGFETGGDETSPTSGVGPVDGDGVSDEGDPGVGDPTMPSETTPSNAGSAPGTGTSTPISPPATTTVPPTTTATTPTLPEPDEEPATDPIAGGDDLAGGEPAPGAMNDGGVDGGVPSEGGTLFEVDANVGDADAGEGGTP